MIWPSWVKKPFGAAALSFVFPGLGQIAAGDKRRGAIVAIPAIAITLVLLALVLFARHALLDNATNQQWLSSLMLLNLVALIYHFWAMSDAYFVAAKVLPKEQRRKRRASGPGLKWTSALAVVANASGPLFVHGVIAVEDASLQSTAACLNSPIPCWLKNMSESSASGAVAGNQADAGPAKPGQSLVAAIESTTASSSSSGSAASQASLPAVVIPGMQTTQNSSHWKDDNMLNLLLVGMDSAPGRTDTLTDTMILLQVNLKTGQSAMYGISRNMYCMPLPDGIAVHFPNDPATYACPKGRFTSPIDVNGESNALFYDAAFVHRDWYPGYPLSACDGKTGSDLTSCKLGQDWGRGTFALEQAVGALTGVTVDGSVVINLPGFVKLIDDLGGIDITVPSTVTDYPCGPKGTWAAKWRVCDMAPKLAAGNGAKIHNGYVISDETGSAVNGMLSEAAASGGLQSISWHQGPDIAFTIKPGKQHMNGEWALAYARSRAYYTDYDRMARQQLVLRTIGNEVKACTILPRLLDPNGILHDLGNLMWTDMPTDGGTLTALAGVAKNITGDSVQRYSLDPNSLLSPSGTTMIMENGWAKAQYIVKHGLDKAPAAGASSGSSAAPGGGGLGC